MASRPRTEKLRGRTSLELGFRRIAVVLMITWALSWGTIFFIEQHHAKVSEAAASVASSCLDFGACDGFDKTVTEDLLVRGIPLEQQRKNEQAYIAQNETQKSLAQQWMARALWWGIGGCIFIPAGIAALVWVWRGFVPPSTSN